MKFVVALVMLALALGSESSVIPLAPLSYTAVHGPTYLAAPAPHASVAVHAKTVAALPATVVAAHAPAVHAYAPAAVAVAAGPAHYVSGPAHYVSGPAHYAVAPAHVAVAPAHVAVAHAAPAVIAHAAPAVIAAPIAHEGSYVAKTRGAVHVAPLAGHANSAASINLEAAPGTV